jgi:uncharacterized membrane protein
MIDPQISEWISQILRWTHVITAIAWIGSSFYFIHLDLSLKKREGLAEGVGGEAWQVHGGGFYNMRKYLVAPPELPRELTWFKWESYSTWISGFFLIVWVYYLHADLYTIDPAVRALQPWQASAIGIGGIALSWLVYEGLCRSPLGRNGVVLGIALFFYVLAAAYAFTQVFNGRAAFLHTGAMIATWMSASVFFIIIPNQKKVVAELLAGRSPDPRLGKEAKLRSTHNNYLTLPVIFLMLSNHYPLAWSSRHAVAIIGLIVVTGAVIRHFFNSQHAGKGSPCARRLLRRGGAGHPVPLLHVPCGGTRLGGHRHRPEGRAPRHPRGDRPPCGGHPDPERSDPRHAAQQHHRDDPGRAQGRGNLAGGPGHRHAVTAVRAAS